MFRTPGRSTFHRGVFLGFDDSINSSSHTGTKIRSPALCAGLPTPHKNATAGLPKSLDGALFGQTFARQSRRGQETCTQRVVRLSVVGYF